MGVAAGVGVGVAAGAGVAAVVAAGAGAAGFGVAAVAGLVGAGATVLVTVFVDSALEPVLEFEPDTEESATEIWVSELISRASIGRVVNSRLLDAKLAASAAASLSA